MTKEELLAQLGLTEDEFRDLVQRFIIFLETLNDAQQDAVQRSLPTLAEAAKSFRPNISPAELDELLKEILDGIDFFVAGCGSLKTQNQNAGSAIDADPAKPSKP